MKVTAEIKDILILFKNRLNLSALRSHSMLRVYFHLSAGSVERPVAKDKDRFSALCCLFKLRIKPAYLLFGKVSGGVVRLSGKHDKGVALNLLGIVSLCEVFAAVPVIGSEEFIGGIFSVAARCPCVVIADCGDEL